MIGELWATVTDAVKYGDWRGHARALCAVLLGLVTPEDRASLPTGGGNV